MEIAVFSSFDNHFSTCGLCLIVEVQVCQSSSCLAECPEIRRFLHQGDTRQHLFQVRSKGFPVVRGVQQAIDVVEDVFLGHFGAIAFPAAFQNEAGDAILACVFLITSVKKRCLIGIALFIIVEREALSFFHKFQVWQLICYHNGKTFSISCSRHANNQIFTVLYRKEFWHLIDHFIYFRREINMLLTEWSIYCCICCISIKFFCTPLLKIILKSSCPAYSCSVKPRCIAT